jgi:hypothetical protein
LHDKISSQAPPVPLDEAPTSSAMTGKVTGI